MPLTAAKTALGRATISRRSQDTHTASYYGDLARPVRGRALSRRRANRSTTNGLANHRRTVVPFRLRSAARIAACRSMACFRGCLRGLVAAQRRQSRAPSLGCQPARSTSSALRNSVPRLHQGLLLWRCYAAMPATLKPRVSARRHEPTPIGTPTPGQRESPARFSSHPAQPPSVTLNSSAGLLDGTRSEQVVFGMG